MNPLSEFLEELASRDIRVWTDSGSLRCSCPSHLMTPELRADLAAHKSELLRFLERPSPLIDRDFDSENAWMGAELTSGTGFVPLTEPCFREIDSLCSELRERPGPREALHPEDFELPACCSVMDKAKRLLDAGPGFAVIDRLDLTTMSADEARAVYRLLASMLARPVPLKWDGTMMRDVTDLGKRSMRAVDTTDDMNYHTDNSYNVCPPDYVGLLCLQKAREGGVSKLVSFPSVHNEMRRSQPELLARLYGQYRFNRQGEHDPDEETTLRRPIFESIGGELAARMSRFHVRTGHALAGEPLDPQGEAAMDSMERIMNEPGFGLDLWFEAGQIQFIDNRRIGHKRTSFSDWPEPAKKRRLVRLWLRDSGRPLYNG